MRVHAVRAKRIDYIIQYLVLSKGLKLNQVRSVFLNFLAQRSHFQNALNYLVVRSMWSIATRRVLNSSCVARGSFDRSKIFL